MKIIFTIILLIIGMASYSQMLSLDYSIELGWMPNQANLIVVPFDSSEMYQITAEVKLNFNNNAFFIQTSAKTFMQSLPIQAVYIINAGINPVKGIEIGWRGICNHQIMDPNGTDIDTSLDWSKETYSEIYIKCKWELPLID